MSDLNKSMQFVDNIQKLLASSLEGSGTDLLIVVGISSDGIVSMNLRTLIPFDTDTFRQKLSTLLVESLGATHSDWVDMSNHHNDA